MPSEKDGVMIVLSSPSGAGKTTLVKMLSEINNFEISVSHTTRQPRHNEITGRDYIFVNQENFNRLIKNEEFGKSWVDWSLSFAGSVIGHVFVTPAGTWTNIERWENWHLATI